MHRRTILGASAAAAIVASMRQDVRAQAQGSAWPTKPITLMVPFPAGGPSDALGRILARGLSAELGQQVVIENKGGMGGLIGVAALAKAPPDGYTIGMNATGPTAIAPFMVPNMPVEDKDLALLTPIALVQMVVRVVNDQHAASPQRAAAAHPRRRSAVRVSAGSPAGRWAGSPQALR